MRVSIDADKCHGHARCALIVPELFDTDDLGNGVVLGDGVVPAELAARARQAIANCPERAISQVDEG